VLVSCAFALVVGGVAGIITTFTHAQLRPWGLVAGLAIALALVLGFRLVFESRVVGAAGALGFVAGTMLLMLPASGTAVLVLNGPIGWIWVLGPAVLAVVALAQPWPGRPSQRP
jgi:hypothetical protein